MLVLQYKTLNSCCQLQYKPTEKKWCNRAYHTNYAKETGLLLDGCYNAERRRYEKRHHRNYANEPRPSHRANRQPRWHEEKLH